MLSSKFLIVPKLGIIGTLSPPLLRLSYESTDAAKSGGSAGYQSMDFDIPSGQQAYGRYGAETSPTQEDNSQITREDRFLYLGRVKNFDLKQGPSSIIYAISDHIVHSKDEAPLHNLNLQLFDKCQNTLYYSLESAETKLQETLSKLAPPESFLCNVIRHHEILTKLNQLLNDSRSNVGEAGKLMASIADTASNANSPMPQDSIGIAANSSSEDAEASTEVSVVAPASTALADEDDISAKCEGIFGVIAPSKNLTKGACKTSPSSADLYASKEELEGTEHGNKATYKQGPYGAEDKGIGEILGNILTRASTDSPPKTVELEDYGSSDLTDMGLHLSQAQQSLSQVNVLLEECISSYKNIAYEADKRAAISTDANDILKTLRRVGILSCLSQEDGGTPIFQACSRAYSTCNDIMEIIDAVKWYGSI